MRCAREKSKTGIYHVMIRGINRQGIFRETEDYDAMLKSFQRLDVILQLNGRELLTHAGKISHDKALKKSSEEFQKYKELQQAIEKEQSLKEIEEDIKKLKK